jgi:hypothetical protein
MPAEHHPALVARAHSVGAPSSMSLRWQVQRRDVDPTARGVLDGADAHDRGLLPHGLDQGRREVRPSRVVDPTHPHTESLAGRQPRVGDTREVRGHQHHFAVRVREQRAELAQTLTGPPTTATAVSGAPSSSAAAVCSESRISASAWSGR